MTPPNTSLQKFMTSKPAPYVGMLMATVVGILFIYSGLIAACFGGLIVGVLLYILPKTMGADLKKLVAFGIVFFIVSSVFSAYIISKPMILNSAEEPVSWDFDDEIEEELILVALWELKEGYVFVTFDPNDGSDPWTESIKIGLEASDPNYTRVGYTLLGWYNGDDEWNFSTDLSKDVTLTAEWERTADVLVTLNPNNGELVTVEVFAFNDTISEPAVTRDGYDLLGWYNNGVAWDFNDMVTEDITLTAEWTLSSGYVLVTFDPNNGSASWTVASAMNTLIADPDIETKGYDLLGWYNNGVAWDFDNDDVTGDITLTAQWERDSTLRVIFYSGYGDGIQVDYVASGNTISAPTVTRDGYDLLGWYVVDGYEYDDFSNMIVIYLENSEEFVFVVSYHGADSMTLDYREVVSILGTTWSHKADSQANFANASAYVDGIYFFSISDLEEGKLYDHRFVAKTSGKDDVASPYIFGPVNMTESEIDTFCLTWNAYNIGLDAVLIFFLIVLLTTWMRKNLEKTRERLQKEGRLYPPGYGRCKDCGTLVLPGEVVCRKCGAYIDVPEEMKAKKAEFFECSECGKEVPEGADVCPSCGAVFDPEVPEFFTCSECGEEVPADADACPKCGLQFYNLKKDESLEEKKGPTFTCSECKKEVPEDAEICPHCGERFDD